MSCLKLDFGQNPHISDLSVIAIANSIEDFVDLHEIEFIFDNTQVTDKVLSEFDEQLKQFKKLKPWRVDKEEKRIDQREYELIAAPGSGGENKDNEGEI
mmetsp:Transcript_29828/g.27316  ORF Transcript_29828/g.27316 Transcript_29828/m.27316 type:complete len:99 (+) Transcript_29828:1736-2032(+)|eukprot:CAMPEP_0114580348 /NCGR_PEP_ID=MMETSP0125-20121206/4662_1 /TAXON_ID=485358 ORGANISM="Aristerostoma sp., Strain ATCC 50986" /NCGR_SAMPLE_ID=MMETSP0125 /ASSEMBLY_ACC=CAM_ASM_000245 /LENGTH=98 /DNA_ID=CAMNT_0001771877 /DNA_START=1664 /DNA_END=1960 /DNA_ORIENTATION=-